METVLKYKKPREVYVRCQHDLGIFEHERRVNLSSDNEWIFVNKEDVKRLKEGGYAVKVLKIKEPSLNPPYSESVEKVFLEKPGKVYVLISDLGDYKPRLKEVALDDIVKAEEIK